MARRIYKYPLEVKDYITLELPKGAELLDVHVQFGKVVIWAIVDPDETEIEKYYLRIYGTGHELAPGRLHKYLGTFQLLDGAFVGHVFELDL